MLKTNCGKWSVKIGNKIKLFNSDMELDNFIKQRYNENPLLSLDKVFSINFKDDTLSKLKTLEVNQTSKVLPKSVQISADGDYEKDEHIPRGISVTRIIGEFKKPKYILEENKEKYDDTSGHFVTPFDLENWRAKELNSLMDQGLTRELALSQIQQKENSWVHLTNYGTQIHAIGEYIIRGEQVSYEDFVKLQKKNIKHIPDKYILSKIQYENTTEAMISFMNSIRAKHGNNVEILAEFGIKSKELNDIYKKAYNVDFINGRIDMLVIDNTGKVHIYDFKVSRKSVGNWDVKSNLSIDQNEWHSTKKETITYQMSLYRAMLEQHGLKVGTTNIIPIKIDLEYEDENEINISKLIGVSIDPTITEPKGSSGRGYQYKMMKNLFDESVIQLEESNVIKEITEPLTILFPDFTLAKRIKTKDKSVDRILNNGSLVTFVKKSDHDGHKGAWKFYSTSKILGNEDKWVYANSKSELIPYVKDYIDRVNADKNEELVNFGQRIISMQNGLISEHDKIIESQGDIINFTSRHLLHYVRNDWKLLENDELFEIGIFIFIKDNDISIVGISNLDLYQDVDFSEDKGSTLLGRFLKDDQVDTKKILKANYGNLELMKILTYLNNNKDKYSNFSIGKISIINPWFRKHISEDNKTLKHNYQELLMHTNRSTKSSLKYYLDAFTFKDPYEVVLSHLEIVYNDSILEKIGSIKKVTSDADRIVYLSQLAEEVRSKLLANGQLENVNFDKDEWRIYGELTSTIAILKGYKPRYEKDVPNYLGFDHKNKAIFTGGKIAAAEFSPSETFQEMSRLFDVVNNRLREEKLKIFAPIRSKLQKFYENNGKLRIIGGEHTLFKNWFVRDNNGKIDPSFRLKDPSDPSLQKHESDMLKDILDTLAITKHGSVEDAKRKNDYYNVPLIRGNFRSHVSQMGVIKATKNAWAESGNYLDIEPDFYDVKRTIESGGMTVFDQFDINDDTRSKLLEEKGVEYYETDLEKILRKVLDAKINKRVLDQFLPSIQGFRMGVKLNSYLGGDSNENIVKLVDDFIKTNVFDEPIMDPGLIPLYKITSRVRGLVTGMTLGFNTRSGFRELLQGMFTNISRTAVELYGKDQFTKSELAWALKVISTDGLKNIGIVTILDHFNWLYGFANAEGKRLMDEMRVNKFGIMNASSDLLYFFAKSPDMLHRLALLLAKMKHDGAWDAHTLVGDQLVYDWKKDKRFAIYISGDVNHKEYKFQKTTYLKFIEQFNEELGLELKEGDALPRAYTLKESAGLKSFSDFCFGHYDKHTQMQVKFTFIGSLFFHFRTFFSSKLEQWILKPGTYNQVHLNPIYDDDGQRMVYKYVVDKDGSVEKSITKENDDSLKDEGVEWEPIMEWTGRPLEGIAYSMLSWIRAIRNKEERAKLMKDPIKVANLKLFIHDMFIMMLLAWMISLAFGLAGGDDDDAVMTKWASGVMTGSVQDFPIHSVVSSMFGDLNPPMWSMTLRTMNNTWKLVSDDQKMNTMLNYFGATKEWTDFNSVF